MLAHLAAKQLDGVMDREEVARRIVDSAAAIHTALGPGLLASVYRRCLMYELGLRGLDVHAEYPIPIRYKEVVLDCGYRAHLLNNNHEVLINILFAVFEVFVVLFFGIALFKIISG
jgi:hypothetical protein